MESGGFSASGDRAELFLVKQKGLKEVLKRSISVGILFIMLSDI